MSWDPGEPLVGTHVAPPSPADFTLSAGNLVAGDINTFTITGAPANSLVLVGTTRSATRLLIL